MRVTEQQLRSMTRKIIAELFTKKSDFSIAHALGGDVEDEMYGYGGLYDDSGDFFGESDEEEIEENEEDVE